MHQSIFLSDILVLHTNFKVYQVRVNTNNGKNQKKYVIPQFDKHNIHFTSSRSSGEALLVKLYLTYICQYHGLVVKELTEIRI